ncbi:hypothetical protein CDAR_470241 [Caerostris darwini]|uniref:Uncharacterized protein n=1 Tax=Caerostris darwini TaxID=1538125 RepID=A0AAV4PU89_9ARAC|nr:hypothetical protein CDAR_470241 [Caerostris darwini]
MDQGVLYRYAPESESEEPQPVAPEHERTLIIQEHHDALTPEFNPGDQVCLTVHPVSNTAKERNAKLISLHVGPYIIYHKDPPPSIKLKV